jgi:RHS repeat-associated protein
LVAVVTGSAVAQVGREPPRQEPRTFNLVQVQVPAQATGATDLSGTWHGNLSAPGDSSAAQWAQEFTLTQDASGNVTGTRKTVALGAAVQFVWSESGTFSGNNLVLNDVAVVSSQGSTNPCKTTQTLAVSTDGSSFSGTWAAPTQSGCNGGTIAATKYGGTLAKHLGSGLPCDGGVGEIKGGGGSGGSASGNADGSSCAEEMGSARVGDPIDASTGNFFLQEDDFSAGDWLTVTRFYNSAPGGAPAAMGFNWRHNYDRSLQVIGQPATTVILLRPDGKQETFTKSAGTWTSDTPVDVLAEVTSTSGTLTGYRAFIGGTRQTEDYGLDGKLTRITGQDGQGVTLAYTVASSSGPAGLLSTVTDSFGRKLSYSYDRSTARLTYITLPGGGGLSYSYDAKSANLTSVYYPDYDSRSYKYGESDHIGAVALPNAMTGIVDGLGQRFENITYDDQGRATSSAFGSGVGSTRLAYNADGSVDLTYPLGNVVHMGLTTTGGQGRVSSLSAACAPDCGQPWKSRTYDAYGFPAVKEDFNGNQTTTRYNAYQLLEETVEAAGTDNQRTTTTTWDLQLRLPLTEAVKDSTGALVKTTSWVYDANGRMRAECQADPSVAGATSYACAPTGQAPAGVRRWTYTYCSAVDTTQCPQVGLLLTTTGPRRDVVSTTTYAYYLTDGTAWKAGDLHTVTDAVNHVTTFPSYDGAGRPTRAVDGNGTITDFTYDAMGRTTTQTVRANADGSSSFNDATRSVSYQYGMAQSVRDPDGITQSFTYDGAHRVTDISFGGGRLHYEHDGAGNITKTQTFNSSGIVVKSVDGVYDIMGRLVGAHDGLGQGTYNASFADSFDGNGNVLHASNAWNQYRHAYDAMNRIVTSTDGVGAADAGSQNRLSVFSYDALGGLAGVNDPDGLMTTFGRSGFSDVTAVTSPDTGATAIVYNEDGQIASQTDAKGQLVTFTYDASGRRVTAVFPNAADNVAWFYDEPNTVTGCSASAPIGRLTRVVEANVSTIYCYDQRGNVIQKSQVQGANTDTVAYTYTNADRLASVTLANGNRLTYRWDYTGHIYDVALTTADTNMDLVRDSTYLPLGPIISYDMGYTAGVATLSYDLNYNLTDIVSDNFNLHQRRDAAGRVSALGADPGVPTASESYLYDGASHLASVTGTSGVIEGYTYSKAGDRLSKVGAGLATGAYGYASGTHRLTSMGMATRAYDPNGATTGLLTAGEQWALAYDGQGRLSEARRGGAVVGTYRYNALGQRISKQANGVTTRFVYNEDGRLLAEFGATTRLYAWMDDRLVATVDTSAGASTVSHVYTDDLGAPRVVINDNGDIRWLWAKQGNPFGEKAPVSADGYVLNLRLPGQYADNESGLFYNNARYYDPTTGRYVTSDPFGLNGGLDTYAYAESSPLTMSDPSGFCAKNPNNPKCKTPIMQPQITKYFGQLGRELGINPLFVMSTALQESGWDMGHVYETNPGSGGKPLNNLFGMTKAGKNNLAYSSLDEAAARWRETWQKDLSGKPQTIQDYAKAVTSTPGHFYNQNFLHYRSELAARYKQLVSATADCGTTF